MNSCDIHDLGAISKQVNSNSCKIGSCKHYMYIKNN